MENQDSNYVEQVTEKPKPAKKRKAKKRRVVRAKSMLAPGHRAADPPVLTKHDDMDGITPQDCPMACTAGHCVISGVGICSHPHKGGLQAGLQNPDAMRRYNAAKRALGKRKLELAADS